MITAVSKTFRRIGFAIAVTMLSGHAVANATTPQGTLKVGDQAPALVVQAWIQGKPVARFEPGHAYVVEFWATWCAFCKRRMPYLGKLQQKYVGRVTVIGVSSREEKATTVAAVRAYAKKYQDQMTYTVAMDDPVRQTSFRAWMTAAGRQSVPTVFVVDGKGRVAWIGYPENLEPKLDRVLAGQPVG